MASSMREKTPAMYSLGEKTHWNSAFCNQDLQDLVVGDTPWNRENWTLKLYSEMLYQQLLHES